MFKHNTNEKKLFIAKEPDESKVNAVASELNILPSTAKLLCIRGYDTPETARQFIEMRSECFYDAFLLADMDKATDRIIKAVKNHERIVIYGDYDVDGVTSVTSLYLYLKEQKADVSYYIPKRIGEGYGVNKEAVKKLADDGYTLMVTVDTGVTAFDEVEYGKSLGLDTVVTDHHDCMDTLPDAVAVVNPCRHDSEYPFESLAGVGVAFKLMCALEEKLNGSDKIEATEKIIKAYGELIAIGTVADVMPLVCENRIIVSYGLHLIEKTSNCGIKALLCASGAAIETPDGELVLKKKITSSVIGFTLAPRINAAGRIANAEMAVELFVTNDSIRAGHIAAELCEINRQRQAEEERIMESAQSKISEQCLPDDYVIILDDDSWHHGVIGIVSSRLTEKYNLPSILISFEGSVGQCVAPDDIGKGSGRSVKGMNLVEALRDSGDLLVKYGGHELAAGLSVKRGELENFRRRINKFAAEAFKDNVPCRTVYVDMELDEANIGLELAGELLSLEPFGTANPQPVFISRRMTVTDIQALSGGKHTKITVKPDVNGLLSYTALYFGKETASLEFGVGDVVDIVYNLDINEFRGRSSIQLMVKEIFLRRYVPVRDDFVKLYRFIQVNSGIVPSAKELENALVIKEDVISDMLDVFKELEICEHRLDGRLVLAKAVKKMSLDDSEIYRKMKNEY